MDPAEHPPVPGRPVIWHGPPLLPRIYLHRDRLWAQLDRATNGAVTVLVAPPGAGKTLGVSGWIRERAAQARPEVLWIDADRECSGPRLSGVLDEAAGRSHPSAHPVTLVVIDDAQRLHGSALAEINRRLANEPQRLRLLLVSRCELALDRLAPELRGDLTVLRGDLLRLDTAESRSLITEHAGTAQADVVDPLVRRSDGWCAVAVLAARTVAAAVDPVATACRYATDHLSVADRVASEALSSLTTDEQQLLLCVANEEVVTAELATHLTGDPHADRILQGLQSTGLLITRLSGSRSGALGAGDDPALADRYRIHPLLAEVVRRRLAVDDQGTRRARESVQHAVALDLARGDIDRGLDRLAAVGDLVGAAELIARHGIELVDRGRAASIADLVARHPEAVADRPETWFAVAWERWLSGDIQGALHWMDRLCAAAEVGARRVELATVRLLQARLGQYPLRAAETVGQAVVDAGASNAGDHEPAAFDVLRIELGSTQNWLGSLAAAELNLTSALGHCRATGMFGLAAAAASHLAFTQYLCGREQVCAAVAADALGLVDACPDTDSLELLRIAARAGLAADLAADAGVRWTGPGDPDPVVSEPDARTEPHPADLCTRFWRRTQQARHRLREGYLTDAERILATPVDLPVAELPSQLRVAVLTERGLLASLSTDIDTLEEIQRLLDGCGAYAEAALLSGLGADRAADRRAALVAFRSAAGQRPHPQLGTTALALCCEAQLLAVTGDLGTALLRLRDAAARTATRRQAVPFLGWTRQGTPMQTLLLQLCEQVPDPWIRELTSAMSGRADVATQYAAASETPQERHAGQQVLSDTTLSARERAVLIELARGSTYADIGRNLFVSENTVKSHVSRLYTKLGASRRSEALAVARSMHLL